jgi:hypothetical protein
VGIDKVDQDNQEAVIGITKDRLTTAGIATAGIALVAVSIATKIEAAPSNFEAITSRLEVAGNLVIKIELIMMSYCSYQMKEVTLMLALEIKKLTIK